MKKNKGITLIALVITIIVLLILVGISIAILTGENGILSQAKVAKEASEIAEEKEYIRLAVAAVKSSKLEQGDTSKISSSELQNELDRMQTRRPIVVTDSGTLTVEFTDTNRAYTVDTNGNVFEKKEEEKALSEEELKEKLETETKPSTQTESDDVGIDEYGNIVNMDLWRYEKIDNENYKIASYTEYATAYRGSFINGKIEGNIPTYLKVDNQIYTISELGDFTFNSAMNGENKDLTEFPKIPKTIKVIGNEAFCKCTRLTNITIPNSVTSIGDYAFSECTGLKNITIPNSVTSIGDGTFRECTGLTNITIPNSVTSIGNDAFYATPWYNNQSEGVVYIGNILYEYKGDMPASTEIVVPNNIVSISNYAFRECTGLTNITIPNSVTSIGDRTFNYCENLVTINIDKEKDSLSGSPWGADNATIKWLR